MPAGRRAARSRASSITPASSIQPLNARALSPPTETDPWIGSEDCSIIRYT